MILIFGREQKAVFRALQLRAHDGHASLVALVDVAVALTIFGNCDVEASSAVGAEKLKSIVAHAREVSRAKFLKLVDF